MFLLIAITLLLIPITFQYKKGNDSLFENNLKKFGVICFLSIVFQIVLTFVSFFLMIFAITNSGNKCATGAAGIFAISFFISIFLFFLILLQFFRRNTYH